MSILKIVEYPSPLLRQKALPIEDITPEIKTLANDMLETMYEEQGIGLAANQVGILKRIIVIDLQQEDFGDPLVLINPTIITTSKEMHTIEEGCLSIMPVKAEVTRPSNITVEYMDINGEIKQVEADGLFSSCLQHEIDHLNGILFIDHLSRLKKSLIINKFKKIKKEAQNDEK